MYWKKNKKYITVSTAFLISVILLFLWQLPDANPHTKNLFMQKEEAVITDVSFRQDIPKMIIREVERSRDKIDVMMFKFNYRPLADALVEAKQRGVLVRVLVDKRSLDMKIDQLDMSVPDYLASRGIDVYVYNDVPNILHYKFVIIDDDVVLTGSQNFAQKDIENNQEVFMKVNCDGRPFSNQFNLLLQENKVSHYAVNLSNGGQIPPPCTLKRASTDEKHTLTGRVEYMAFSPENSARPLVIQAIDDAREKIDIMEFSLSDIKIVEALVRAVKRGVSVKVITDVSGGDLCGYLQSEGAECRLYDKRNALMHHKTIMIDNDVVFTGSLNMSRKSLEKDREFFMLIKSQALHDVFSDEFERMYTDDDVIIPKQFNVMKLYRAYISYYLNSGIQVFKSII